jgi:hypothetical protein
MHSHYQYSLISPSNVAIAILAGFLLIGHSSDWRMLHKRPCSYRTVAPSRGLDVQQSAPHDGVIIGKPGDPDSVVADSRPASCDGRNCREID